MKLKTTKHYLNHRMEKNVTDFLANSIALSLSYSEEQNKTHKIENKVCT